MLRSLFPAATLAAIIASSRVGGWVGLGNFRSQGSHECPYCKEFVAVDATKCKWCTADIEPGQVDDEDAVEITTQQRIAE